MKDNVIILSELQQEEKAILLQRFRQHKDVAFDLTQQHWFLQEYLAEMSNITDAKPEALITALLPALAANIGNKAFIQCGFRKHYGNIWSIIIGPSTIGRKTTSINLACAPLKAENRRLKKLYEQQVSDYESMTEDEKSSAEHPDRQFIVYPSCPAEQYLSILGKNPNGILIYSEIADFLTKMNKSFNADFKSMITAMFDGFGGERSTRSFGVEGVETPAFSICTATTREWFLKELDKEHDVNSGFLQRFLVCNSYDIAFDALNFAYREGSSGNDYINERVTHLFAALRLLGSEAEPCQVELSGEAKYMYSTVYREALRPYFQEDDDRMYSYVGRLFEDYFFRFCLVFTLIDYVEHRQHDLIVTPENAEQAHTLCFFYLKNAENFVKEEISATSLERQSKKLVSILRNRLEKKGQQVMSHSLLKNLSHLEAKDFELTISELIEDNVVTVLQRQGKNNKVSKYYQLIIEHEERRKCA